MFNSFIKILLFLLPLILFIIYNITTYIIKKNKGETNLKDRYISKYSKVLIAYLLYGWLPFITLFLNILDNEQVVALFIAIIMYFYSVIITLINIYCDIFKLFNVKNFIISCGEHLFCLVIEMVILSFTFKY